MALFVLFAGFVMYFAVSRILILNVEESLIRFAEQGATTIDTYLEGRLSELKSISTNTTVKNPKLPMEQRLSELEKQLELDSYKRLSIADMGGNARTTDGILLHIEDREYFKKAAKGAANVSDPIVSRADGSLVIVFAVPLTDNGKINGVLYATYDADILSRMTDKIRLNSKGSSFILDSAGNTIAHQDRSLVYNRDNDFVNVKTNPRLKKLVELEKKMISGQSGSGKYSYNGVSKYMGFCPIGDTGWSIAVTSPESEIFGLLSIVFAILALTILGVTFTISWLTTRSRTLQISLSKQEKNSTRVTDVTNLIVVAIDLDGRIVDKNKYAEKLFSKFSRRGEQEIQNIHELLTPYESDKLKELVVSSLLQNISASMDMALKRTGFEPLYLYCSVTNDKETGLIEIMGLDITEKVVSQNELQESFNELSAVYEQLAEKEEGLRNNYNELKQTQEKLKTSENRYQLVIEGSNDAIWDWDAQNDKLFYSDKFYEMTGYKPSEMETAYDTLVSLVHPEDRDPARKATIEYRNGLKPTLWCEVRLKLADGGYRWFILKGKAVFDHKSDIIRAAGSLTDIDERKTHEEMIQKLAYSDSLTGLPNRAAFYKEVKNVFRQHGRNSRCALIYLDLDNFKYVKDSFSHHIGDLLLVEVGKRLKEGITNNELVSRFEADEFVIFIKRFMTDRELEDRIRAVMNIFREPFEISGNNFHITVSCGVSIYPEHASGLEEMLKNSDMAMYRAKKDGKHTYAIYDKSMNDEFLQRINMENGLRRAIENGEFILHYQPQYDLENGKISSFEALIRWMEPHAGMIPPLEFIGVAEETGLIVPIGRWVLQTACAFIKRLNDAMHTSIGIAVNVSIIQLLQADFVRMVRGVLRETGLDPRLLELELTESRMMEMVEVNLQKLTELQELGVHISIDDFGKGFSSLSYLKQLPINSLKIDKSFVDDIENEGKSMIDSIIHIGHQRGLVVIAEGVERKEQMEYLIRCNCDRVQGYYYSRPIPEKDVGMLFQL